ncbi:MAG: YIP1 family protein [bacterium]
MADFHLGRDGETLGVFPEHEIREGLLTGRFLPTDLAWVEGMVGWSPLESMTEFGPPPGDPPPFASTMPTAQSGPPFEERAELGFLVGVFTTISLVLTRPRETFATMRRSGGFGTPILFMLIVGWPVVLVSTFLYRGAQLDFAGNFDLGGNLSGFEAGMDTGLLGASYVFFYPFLVVAGQFFGAGITHLCLLLVGGANHSFETTFRVSCYSTGAASIFNLLPVLGPLLVFVWGGLIVQIVGLSAAHRTSIPRVIFAVFLPLFVVITAALGIVFGLGLDLGI